MKLTEQEKKIIKDALKAYLIEVRKNNDLIIECYMKNQATKEQFEEKQNYINEVLKTLFKAEIKIDFL